MRSSWSETGGRFTALERGSGFTALKSGDSSFTGLESGATCADAALTALESDATCAGATFTALESDATCAGATFTALESGATCAGATFTALESSATCADATFTALESGATCAGATFTALESDATCADATFTALESGATCAGATFTALESGATCCGGTSRSATTMSFTSARDGGHCGRRWRGAGARRAVLLACAAGSAGLAGCMVGPNYSPPKSEVAETWLDVRAGDRSAEGLDPRWWKNFGDPALDGLVEQALEQNLTLRQAGLRVIQSRALRGISVGQFFPQAQVATGEASNNQISRNAPEGRADRSFSEYAVGLEAAWELDFWGRFRRGVESADAALEAAVAEYDAVVVLLVSDVASSYVTIRSLQEQLAFTRANVESQRDTLELTRLRFNAGAVSELDVATAQATLSNTQALVPQLEDQVRQTQLGLCVLLGRTPSELTAELGSGGAVPEAAAELALGVPADLLRRRPDVRRAERTAAALSAQIGVAAADLYPSVTIKGATGFRTSMAESPGVSPGAENLLDADSFQGFIGLAVNWPILNYGRIQNNVRVADARYQEATAAYQEAVLRAAAEVETGLSNLLRSRERATFLGESVSAAQRTVELSLIQYRQGATDFIRVNRAQVDLVERQNSLVVARAGVAQGAIATYRALGGGWEVRRGREFVPRETVEEMRGRTDWGEILSPGYEEGRDLGGFRRPGTGPEGEQWSDVPPAAPASPRHEEEREQ